MRRWVRLLALLLLLLAVGITLSPRGRSFAEAVTLLADVWAIDRGGVAGVPVGTREIVYSGPGGAPRRADLYCDDAGAPRGRLLLVHGLVDTGKDDSRLRALGTALARRQFLVMVPDFPGMRALRAGRADIAEVRVALGELRRRGDCDTGGEARPLQTGVVGFSYSAGPVLLALDDPVRRADFAILFGGYYDLTEVILFLTTGRYREGGIDGSGEVLPEGRWIMLEANASTIADPSDRAALVDIARRRRREPEADLGRVVESLGPAARAALELVTNTDPARFQSLLDGTAPELRDLLAKLSPSRSLEGPIDVDLFLLHGRGDLIVPYTQSLALQRGLRVSGAVRLALLGGFQHARPADREERSWWSKALRNPADSIKLLFVIEEILARRERDL
jgi:pimeloyl-ACP methyl ester carboxylesterase